MATPMSARRRAGPSLTPSPVIATTSPAARRAWMMVSFCSGVARANTCAVLVAAASLARQLTTLPPGLMMPRPVATAAAVAGWSPVMSTGVMPAAWQESMVAAAARRGGSKMAANPSRCSPCSSSAAGGWPGRSAAATARTRKPSRAKPSAWATARFSVAASPVTVSGTSIASGAPLQMTRTPPPGSRCTVVIRLRSLSNGTSAMRGNRAFSSPGSSPSLPAADSKAASVGSPTAVHAVRSPAGDRSARRYTAWPPSAGRPGPGRRLRPGAGRRG
jgi:hypothetical protein